MSSGALLVLDEQLESQRLVAALTDRGHDVRTVGDFGAQGRPDPDVVRRIADQHKAAWVLVTMDLSIIEDFKGFDWDRYAIAWVRIRKELRGKPPVPSVSKDSSDGDARMMVLELAAGARASDHTESMSDR